MIAVLRIIQPSSLRERLRSHHKLLINKFPIRIKRPLMVILEDLIMGNRLTAETLLEIEDRLMNKKEPILKIAREVGVTRNAIKRNFLSHLKNMNSLNISELGAQMPFVEPKRFTVENVNWKRLESLFNNHSMTQESISFEKEIVGVAKEMFQELELYSLCDLIRLEKCVESFMISRILLTRGLSSMGNLYDQSWVSSADKMSKYATRLLASSKLFTDQMLLILKELEIKSGKRYPDMNHNRIIINRNNISLDRTHERLVL